MGIVYIIIITAFILFFMIVYLRHYNNFASILYCVIIFVLLLGLIYLFYKSHSGVEYAGWTIMVLLVLFLLVLPIMFVTRCMW